MAIWRNVERAVPAIRYRACARLLGGGGIRTQLRVSLNGDSLVVSMTLLSDGVPQVSLRMGDVEPERVFQSFFHVAAAERLAENMQRCRSCIRMARSSEGPGCRHAAVY